MVRSNEQNLFEHKKEKQSYLSYLKTFISEDDEASGEYERLLSMLEKSIHLLQEPKMKMDKHKISIDTGTFNEVLIACSKNQPLAVVL